MPVPVPVYAYWFYAAFTVGASLLSMLLPAAPYIVCIVDHALLI